MLPKAEVRQDKGSDPVTPCVLRVRAIQGILHLLASSEKGPLRKSIQCWFLSMVVKRGFRWHKLELRSKWHAPIASICLLSES